MLAWTMRTCSNADLTAANLRDAVLTGADLSNANLTGGGPDRIDDWSAQLCTERTCIDGPN